ncbi:tetratricopeptide repeat protein [Echinicola soli]|uniref:Tetratricopeptide repeat protein n=1 Tax=Echinicola soli TaxID=2591634 RepID=A0A514CML4_9BACT|nr:tetratricopeptide repeat protein [Echinicola soli]QDH81038.1 tetratricopeptide repeat protein [Echinicola soli]
MRLTNIKQFLLFLALTVPLVFLGPTAKAQFNLFKSAKKEKKEEDMAARLFIEGEKHMMLEDYEKAYFYFDKAYDLTPESGAVNFKMAEILARANQNEKALEHGQKAIEADPENKYYHLLIAEVYTKQNQPEKAAEILSTLIESSDDNQQYILELASLYLSTQQFDKALIALDKAEEYYGVVEQLSVQKQRIYLKQNNLDAAIKEGEKLIDANPGNSRYVLALVEMLFNNNRTDQALDVVNASLGDYPNQADLHLAAYTLYKKKSALTIAREHLFTAFHSPDLEGEIKAQTFGDILQKDLRTKEREAMLDSLENLMVKTSPKSAPVFTILGDRAMQNQQPAKALEYYQQSIAIHPQDAKVLQGVISLMFEQGKDFKEIEEYTVIGTEEFPKKPEFWFFDGTAKLALKQHSAAEASLKQSLELNDGVNKQLDLMVLGQLGDTYHALDKEDQAFEAYGKVLEISPEDEHVLNNYAYFLSLEKKDLDKALEMSSKLVKRFPDNATYLDTHAWVLFQKKAYQDAEKYMKKALELEDSPSGIMLEHYGDILYHLGDKTGAMDYWEKAAGQSDVSDELDQKIKNKKYYE